MPLCAMKRALGLRVGKCLPRNRSAVRHRLPSDHSISKSLALGLCAALLVTIPQITTPNHAFAQIAPKPQGTLLGQGLQVDEDKPMLLQADELIYDNQNESVIARGNVELYFNNYTLLADEVHYRQSTSTLEAMGNVRIKEPNGAVVNADRITLTDDFRDGFIGSLKIVTKEDARIAAALATRQDGETTIFERGVFTPCKPCRDNPEKAPLWRIKAAKIIHKESEGNIYYEDASFEMFGVPLFWLPYFYHADPSVKRRSGFLIPKIGTSSELGAFVETPYFWEIAPNMDVTLAPRVMSEQGILMQTEFRHRLANGAYTVNLAGIYQDTGTVTSSGDSKFVDNEFRGSVETDGRFSLGSYWNAGWDITLESDDTFRRFYKLDTEVRTDRVSQIYLDGISDRNYFNASMYHFGGLLADDNSNSESRAHPVVDYNYIFADPIVGGELSFNSNFTSLSRDQGADSNGLLAEVKWRRQFIDEIGQVITPFAQARGDVYSVTNFDDPSTSVVEGSNSISRAYGLAGVEYSYPFVAHTDRASHVIEPVGQIIARPDDVEQDGIPNEDARSLVFDDTLLFDTDKFSGYDRIETGVRGNVGLRYTVQMMGGGYARAVIGQSFHLGGMNAFDPGTGLDTDQSDYVAGLYVEPSAFFRLMAQTRFDDNNFEVLRQDLGAGVNYGPAAVALNYAFTRATPLTELTEDQQEVIASGSLKLVGNWSLLGGLRYDVEDDFFLTSTGGIQYSDECFTLAVTYTESNISDRDLTPDQTISIRFELKHLGGTTYNASISDDLTAQADPS